jgi:hypothetical protein
MILYLSGNFPQLSKIEKEQAMAEHNEKNGSGYHRLMSFYYVKDCNTILNVAKKIKKPKITLHRRKV